MVVRSPTNAVERALYNVCWILDHVFGQQAVRARMPGLRRRLDQRIRRSVAAGGPGRRVAVPREHDLTPVAFRRRYLARARPVVMAGLGKGWRCCREWTLPLFAERYGGEPVRVINGAPGEQLFESGGQGRQVSLADVIGAVEGGSANYARFSPLLHTHPELCEDFDEPRVRSYFNRLRRDGAKQLFIGGAGTVTATHNALPNNLFLQVHGEKRWWLWAPSATPVMAPPLTRAPFFFSGADPLAAPHEQVCGLADTDVWEVTLVPGDVLFIPSFHWHYVQNLTATIGVSFRWVAPHTVARASLTQGLLTALSRNPPILEAMRREYMTDFTKLFAQVPAVPDGDRTPPNSESAA